MTSMDIEDEMTKSAISLATSVVDDLVRPTSKSIGDNIGLFVDGVFGWLGYWGEKQRIKREKYLNEYKNSIAEKVANISEDKLIEPKLQVVGPAIEASKYFIEEKECREMFSNLVASACNSDLQSFVHPAFPEMIKQLSCDDARFLMNFKYKATFPCVELYELDIDKKITPYYQKAFDLSGSRILYDEKQELGITQSVDNLIRLGLLTLNKKILELNYDYNKFISHWLYKAIYADLRAGSTLHMRKYRIELTVLGKAFVKCCV